MNKPVSSRDSLFTKAHQLKIKDGISNNYFDFIEDIREDLRKGFSTDVIDPQFLDQLNDIIHDEAFDDFSPLKFYWMNLLDNLVYLIQLHEEILNADEYNESAENLSETEEELYQLWHESEFAKTFLELLDSGMPVLEASDQLVPLLENQIISFYVLHINEYQQEFDDPIVYQAIPELGDYEGCIHLYDDHQNIQISTVPESFPTILIKAINPEKGLLTIESNDVDAELKYIDNKMQLAFGENKISLVANYSISNSSAETVKAKIKNSFDRLKSYSAPLFFTTINFIETIILTHDETVKSNSLQSLPFYISLNAETLIEDEIIHQLVYESSSQYLFAYLNQMDLYKEEGEKNLYSPWRNDFASIDELYFDFFSNYFLFELYLNRRKEKQDDLDFNDLLADHLLINLDRFKFATSEFDNCFKNKILFKNGMDLIVGFNSKIQASANDVAFLKDKISLKTENKFNELKGRLTKIKGN